MQIDASLPFSPGAVSRNRFEDLTSADFMKIMFTELTHQDPLKPQDTQALLNQISTVRNIESNSKLMNELSKLVSQNQFAMAGTLVGKTITGLDESFFPAEGQVKSAGFEGNRIILTLDSGARVPMEHVESIREPEAIGA